MARYMETAAEANEVAKMVISFITDEEDRPKVAELLARLVNLGIRCSPRGVQHTVRLNAVRAAMRGLPVRVSMVTKTDPKTNRTYNALTTEQVGGVPAQPFVEAAVGEGD